MSRRSRRRRRRRARADGPSASPALPLAPLSLERVGPHLLRLRVVFDHGVRVTGGCAGITSALLFASLVAAWLGPDAPSPGQHLAHLLLAPLLGLVWLGTVTYREETELDRERDLLTSTTHALGLSTTRRRPLGDATALVHVEPSPRGPPRFRLALRLLGGEVVALGPARAYRSEASQDAVALRAFLRETSPPPAAPGAPGVTVRRSPAEVVLDDWFVAGEPAPAECPLCRDPVSADPHAPGLPVVACRSCDTRYHEPCALELGHCAVLGCQRARAPHGARTRTS